MIPDLILELGDSKVGYIPKDKASGKLAEEWNMAITGAKASVQFIDVTVAISSILADKDSDELVSGKLSSTSADSP